MALASLLHGKEYVVPAGDVGAYFRSLPEDATVLSFSAASRYSSTGDITLPSVPLLIIDGKGCTLELGPDSHGFTNAIGDQHAAAAHASYRYVIKDFAVIEGGRKAIDLCATLGSTIVNVKCVRQTETAVDLRFCLLARLEHVLVTNPIGKGIVLRQGDWAGATWANSQSNSCVLEQCRVNCSSTTSDAYTILHSGGVRMTDCVSEGAACDRDLVITAATDANDVANNTVVKSFTLWNFHVEHAARISSILVNMPAKCVVDLGNIYWNAKQTAPVIEYTMGQLNLHDIGWWQEGFRIRTHVSAPRINIERCHSALDIDGKNERTPSRIGCLELVDALPGNGQLKLDYVRVRERSM